MDLRQLDEEQCALLAVVDGWPEERLSFRPSAAEWSAAQVFDHLERTERQILAAAKIGLARPHTIGVRDRLGTVFIEKVFATDRKVKVPASAKAVLPEADPRLAEVLTRWKETRSALRQFHDALNVEQRSAGLFRHPVAGWMNMAGILRFFSVHMRHHAYQLEQLRIASERLAFKG